MQVSATLIAAQQAAREAQARFQKAHAPTLQTNFASALSETAKADEFSPLPLRQTASQTSSQPAAAAPQEAQAAPTRMGTLLDIKV